MVDRKLASFLTGLSMALGVASVVCVIVIHRIAVDQFEQDAGGYHFIVGGTGGRLQLVMSTVYHLDRGLFPIDYQHYRAFTDGKYAPYVVAAVPYCLGDSFAHESGKFRVVGTTPDLFDKLEYRPDKKYEFAQGRNFKRENFFEAVIGSAVARQTGLKEGDLFNATHGLSDDEADIHVENAFKIVGVLAPSGTANDRAIFVNMEGFYLLEGHSEAPEEAAPSAGAKNWLGRVASLLQDFSEAEAAAAAESQQPATRDPSMLSATTTRGILSSHCPSPIARSRRFLSSARIRCSPRPPR
jgi:putative ABC transport system permease protein